jgi:hypothetical protein
MRLVGRKDDPPHRLLSGFYPVQLRKLHVVLLDGAVDRHQDPLPVDPVRVPDHAEAKRDGQNGTIQMLSVPERWRNEKRTGAPLSHVPDRRDLKVRVHHDCFGRGAAAREADISKA